IAEVDWMVDATINGRVPAVTVQFTYDPVTAGNVQVTLSNETVDNITISKVGYRILKINSFRLEDLNRVHMPPSSFTAPSSPAVPDGTTLSGFGGNTSFTVSGVGFHDDL